MGGRKCWGTKTEEASTNVVKVVVREGWGLENNTAWFMRGRGRELKIQEVLVYVREGVLGEETSRQQGQMCWVSWN